MAIIALFVCSCEQKRQYETVGLDLAGLSLEKSYITTAALKNNIEIKTAKGLATIVKNKAIKNPSKATLGNSDGVAKSPKRKNRNI